MAKIGSISDSSFGQRMMAEFKASKKNMGSFSNDVETKKDTPSFYDHVSNAIDDSNKLQKQADKLSTDLVSGKSQNIQETMLAATKAELNFNLMVQVRNKALAAYQEIMRMPV